MDGNSSELTVHLPDDLADSVHRLRTATGRDNADIVTSALRTYLADQVQRDTIRVYFDVLPESYPRAYFVTATATLQASVPLEALDRPAIERTFAQINRYATTEVVWAPGLREVTIGMGVSGHSSAQAADTAVKMVRNRLVDEHAIPLDESTDAIRVLLAS